MRKPLPPPKGIRKKKPAPLPVAVRKEQKAQEFLHGIFYAQKEWQFFAPTQQALKKLVWCVRDYHQQHQALPGIAHIAHETGQSVETIISIITRMYNAEFVATRRPRTQGSQRSKSVKSDNL
ncbi:MAG: hypothetical protein Q7R47_03580 [Candidatus Diapherotrites archaeon]|nr:hypothetical protein [Candidatus Diapherotrites archaeon]